MYLSCLNYFKTIFQCETQRYKKDDTKSCACSIAISLNFSFMCWQINNNIYPGGILVEPS